MLNLPEGHKSPYARMAGYPNVSRTSRNVTLLRSRGG